MVDVAASPSLPPPAQHLPSSPASQLLAAPHHIAVPTRPRSDGMVRSPAALTPSLRSPAATNITSSSPAAPTPSPSLPAEDLEEHKGSTELLRAIKIEKASGPDLEEHKGLVYGGCRMFQPDKYPGLDELYEQKHRAVLVERGEVPRVLRLRGHNPNESLLYDPRYEPYFRRMDFLQFVLNFKGTPPWLNATALTALTDRWRPETHSFHLPLGEMTITLKHIGMITGPPIQGRALTGKVRSDGWRQRVAALVCVEPEPWTNEARKDPRPSGVLFSWIQRYFRKCPRDASPLVVERFARAYLWNLLTQVVFPDGTGDTASWMFLGPLRDSDVKWSWGSATLAFLYRQLDGACMRIKPTSTLGGFVWALQVWMWERMPVGRNLSLPPEEPWMYPFDEDEERYPTIAHTWANVQWTSIAAMGRYKAYISELDMLTYEQFGVQQRTPPDYVETSVQLHKTNRQTNKSVINWKEHHKIWVDMWNAQRHARVENDQTPDTDEAAYLRHLEWMRTEYRVIHKEAWTRSDCLDLLPSEAADAAFNNSIRETVGAHLDYDPLHDRVGTELWRCINDSKVTLGRAPSSQTDGFARTTLQKVANRCRTLAALLSCHGVSSIDVRARAQYMMDVQSSARPSASRPRSSSARPSSSRARAYSSRAHVEEFEEEEQESDNEAADPDFIEFGASQMEDAPQPSQPTQAAEETRRASSRNVRCPGWQNTREGYVTKGKMDAKRGRK
ncbi:hypothetical protein D1007_33337 [Hordeum vulgare]|nr:hypothetical protein D1007_33337 [Hordeum vulgare]